QGTHDLLEARDGRGNGRAHLLDLPRVLDETQLRRGLCETCVVAFLDPGCCAHGLDERRDVLVRLSDDEQLCARADILRERILERVEVLRLDSEDGCEVPERRARADPELPVARAREELVGVAT